MKQDEPSGMRRRTKKRERGREREARKQMNVRQIMRREGGNTEDERELLTRWINIPPFLEYKRKLRGLKIKRGGGISENIREEYIREAAATWVMLRE